MPEHSRHIRRPYIFFLYFFCPFFTLVLLIAYGIYVHEIDEERSYIKLLEAEIIGGNEFIIESALSTVVSDLMVLANNHHIREKPAVHMDKPFEKNVAEDFVLLSRATGIYDQIRFIDNDGMEIVRVNMGPNGPYVVPKQNLQNKKNRYYFNDTFELGPGEVYVSPFDLNIEKGVIERPLKPMIRFGTPVFTKTGEKKGVIILNYLGEKLLDKVNKFDSKSLGKYVLVNPDGYYLKGFNKNEEWGFMLAGAAKHRFGNKYPEAWNRIKNQENGQFYKIGHFFTFKAIYPVSAACTSSTGSPMAFAPSSGRIPGSSYHWKIISVIPPAFFHGKRDAIFFMLLSLVAPILLISAIGSWFLALNKFKRIQAQQALIASNEILEENVLSRTADLKQLNQTLQDKILEINASRNVLKESDRYYRSLINSIQEDIMVITKDYIVADVNETFLKRNSILKDQVIGRFCYDVCHAKNAPCVIENTVCPIQSVFETGLTGRTVHQHGHLHKKKTWEEIIFSPLQDSEGTITKVIKVSRDITEERKLEEQLRQAQKMEAIGRLAGGIAHDFNNILFPIMGYTEMALENDIVKNSAIRRNLEEIFKGVLRARDLVAQILAFSYQSEQELKPLKIYIAVKEALKLIKATIPSTINIKTHIDEDCGIVMSDSTQIHQIVMNLCTNAYHAMEGNPGVIEVALYRKDVMFVDESDTDIPPGSYVVLEVSDTGKSIDEENLGHIFEPYFTTKAKNEGTGLGLSVVHGIVKAYGGKISVRSKKDEGTLFRILLPRVLDEARQPEHIQPKELPRSVCSEHLLLVEDDPTIIEMEIKMLQKLGYTVSAFRDAIQAIEVFRKNPASYNLIITDYTMPNMTGETFARKIMEIKHDIPLVLLTGFSGKINRQKALEIGIQAYIMKPVIYHELAYTIRNVLDGKSPKSGLENVTSREPV